MYDAINSPHSYRLTDRKVNFLSFYSASDSEQNVVGKLSSLSIKLIVQLSNTSS